MKYENVADIKTVHQGVDTLRTSHVIMKEFCYENFEKVLSFLSKQKSLAQDANSNYEFENGISFEFLNFGNFKIMPKGQGRYKYVISNQDITVYFSGVKFGANNFNTPQITIDYRSRYLTLIGHDKAYVLVLSMLREILGAPVEHSTTTDIFIKSFCQRIDIATDVSGIQYTPSDKYRFQALFKRNNFIEFFEHLQYNRLTGFSFGKGDFMIRIYDKRLELNRDSSKLYLTHCWSENGYDEINRPPVWRHEVQLRRPHLKSFLPDNVHDEVIYFFNMLDQLWSYSINKINWVDLKEKEYMGIMEGLYTPDAMRQMFYRAKNDKDRFSFWSILSVWKGQHSLPAEKLERMKEKDYRVPKRFLKAFLTTAYKISDGDPLEVVNILNSINSDVAMYDGYTLHQYAQNKLLSSFVDNAYFVSNYGLVVDVDYRKMAFDLYDEIKDVFENLDDPLFKRSKYKLGDLYRMRALSIDEDNIYE